VGVSPFAMVSPLIDFSRAETLSFHAISVSRDWVFYDLCSALKLRV
jgi:hypothetical protein